MDIEQLKKDYLEMLELEMDTYDAWLEFGKIRNNLGKELRKLGVNPDTMD